MKQLFLILMVVFMAKMVMATETLIGSETMVGTQTEGTITLTPAPYITSLKIFPSEMAIKAGGTVAFVSDVIWSDGTITHKVMYSCDKGSFKGNIWTGTQTGEAIITVQRNGIESMAKVVVTPDTIARVRMNITQKIFYGIIYPKTLFDFICYDKYDNIVITNKIESKLRKKSLSHLSTWVGETAMPTLNELIKAGVVFNSELLFFDVGDYEVNVVINDTLQTTFPFNIVFQGYEDVVGWTDYRVINIDFDKGIFTAEYTFIGFPAIQVQFNVKDEWQKTFQDGNTTQRLQVLCWVHYTILQKRAELLKDLEYQQFKDLLLKPILEKLK